MSDRKTVENQDSTSNQEKRPMGDSELEHIFGGGGTDDGKGNTEQEQQVNHFAGVETRPPGSSGGSGG